MPDFTTPVGSRQRYIAALNRAQGDRMPGTKKIFADRQDFLDRIADERACIAMGLPVWFDGIDLKVLSEPASVHRLWSLSTSAGSPTANAAASHGRTVVIGAFSKVLFADASLVHATSGVPAAGLGENGDLALDAVAGIVYEKASGAWAVLVSMYGSGGSSPVAPGAVQNLSAGTATSNSQPLSWQAPATGTGPFTYQVAYRLGTSTGAYTNFGSPVSSLSSSVTGLAAATAYDYQVTAINAAGPGPAATINDASTAAGATAPGAPGAPVATAGDGSVSATWTAPASNGGSAITDYRLRWNGGTPVEMGDADLSGSMPAANGTAGTLEVAARNAIGWGPYSPASNSVTPSAAAPAPVLVKANSSFAQWIEDQIATNTVDRSTAGDYTRVAGAGTAGEKFVTNLDASGSPTQTVQLDKKGIDDHDAVAHLQTWFGRWMAGWNEHGINGRTGFNYHMSATPHGMDYGPVRNVLGVKSGSGGNTASTYLQLRPVDALKRVLATYRAGGSLEGAWPLRFCDNIGAPLIENHVWSEERILHELAYMDTALVGDELRCVCYIHPTLSGDHSIWEFVVNVLTGVISAGGNPIVIGGVTQNAYSNAAGQVPIPSSAMRKVVNVTTGTSRIYSFDGTKLCYQTMSYSSASGGTWGRGTYMLGIRSGDSGAYPVFSVGDAGLPLKGGARGYYGSHGPLSDTLHWRAVNRGATEGVGDFAIELLESLTGWASYTVKQTLLATADILMRLQNFEGNGYFMRAPRYDDYDNFEANTYRIPIPGLVWTKTPSRPSEADPNPVVSSINMPGGNVGTPFSAVPVTSGGTGGPYTYALSAGALPAWASFNTTTGAITGTPNATGTTNGLEITVSDGVNPPAVLSGLSIVVAAASGFVAAGAHTLTNLSVVENAVNQYKAATGIGSQAAILHTGQKRAAGTPAAARLYFNHPTGSGSLTWGTPVSPTSPIASQNRITQITAAGLIQTSHSGGSAISTNYTFPGRSAQSFVEVYVDTDNVVKWRATTDNGATWAAQGNVIEPGGTSPALTGDLTLKFYASADRVIDNPQVSGVVAL